MFEPEKTEQDYQREEIQLDELRRQLEIEERQIDYEPLIDESRRELGKEDV